jgi:hypothetical protein
LFPLGQFFGFFKIVGRKQVMAFIEFVVELSDIVVQHTFHGEMGCYLGDGIADILQPRCGDVVFVAGEKFRDDFRFEHRVDALGV